MARKTSSQPPREKKPSLELRVLYLEKDLDYLFAGFEESIEYLRKSPCVCDTPPGTCRLSYPPGSRKKKKKR